MHVDVDKLSYLVGAGVLGPVPQQFHDLGHEVGKGGDGDWGQELINHHENLAGKHQINIPMHNVKLLFSWSKVLLFF